MLACACGGWSDGRELAPAFREEHKGKGHRVWPDYYRAECKTREGGCRACGAGTGESSFVFYCSRECRDEFEADHFWGTARLTASGGAHPVECARLSPDCRGAMECNHVEPVNGRREFFGCQNHQANLEMLCHHHHLEVTAEQRAAGLIGQPPGPAVHTTGRRHLPAPERSRDAALPGFDS